MPSGILLLDKPQGLSSNGALQRVRRAWRAASAGHVGTLDPMATGMLPICLDEATKVIAAIEGGAKAYEFTLALGARTDTGDADGDVVERMPVPEFDATRLEAALAGFRGLQSQVPPMYSALKREGRPLYELARQGVVVERAPRQVDIRRLEVRAIRADSLDLACECSKGTYIRVLGEDIARALGTVGHLTRLRRPWVEPFRDMAMIGLEEAQDMAGSGAAKLLPPDAALQAVPAAFMDATQAEALRHGQAVHAVSEPPASPGQRVRLYGPHRAFLGLGEVRPDGWLQPRRLLRQGAA